jgi:hypothetical protein
MICMSTYVVARSWLLHGASRKGGVCGLDPARGANHKEFQNVGAQNSRARLLSRSEGRDTRDSRLALCATLRRA